MVEPIPAPEVLLAQALERAVADIPTGAELGRFAAWDSFAHLNVMLALEQHYRIEITDKTIRQFASLEAIIVHYRELVGGKPAAASRTMAR